MAGVLGGRTFSRIKIPILILEVEHFQESKLVHFLEVSHFLEIRGRTFSIVSHKHGHQIEFQNKYKIYCAYSAAFSKFNFCTWYSCFFTIT